MDGEVSYVPTEDQAAQASRDAFVARLRRGRTWRAAFILCAFLGGVLAFLDWTDGYEPLHIAMSFFVGFGLIVAVQLVAWGSCFLALPRRARRAFREMRVRQGPYRWTWDAEGFAITTPNGGGAYLWDEVLRGVDGRHAFILWFSESAPLFLPHEVLEPGQEQSFRAAMQAGLAGRG